MHLYVCEEEGGTEERSIIIPPADVMLNFKAAPSISNNNPSKGCNEHTHTHWRTGTTRANTFAPSGVGLGQSSRVGALTVHRQESGTNNRGKEGRRYPGQRFSPLSQPQKGWWRRQLGWPSRGCKFVIAGMSLAFTAYLKLKLDYRIG